MAPVRTHAAWWALGDEEADGGVVVGAIDADAEPLALADAEADGVQPTTAIANVAHATPPASRWVVAPRLTTRAGYPLPIGLTTST
jgi:hypothetical protein